MCSTAGFGAGCCSEKDNDVISKRNNQTNERTNKCFKCKTSDPFVVIRNGDPFCGPCFDAYLIHKFRQGLGKHKVLYPGETVLLHIPGTISSLAMLQLMATGYDQASHKKITAVPKLIIIDDSLLFDIGESPVPDLLRIIEKVPGMPKQTFIVPFAMIFMEDFEDVCRKFCSENSERSIVDLNEVSINHHDLVGMARSTFEGMSTASAREDVHRSLHSKILHYFAKILDSTKIMLSETSLDLASRLLTSVSVGRGPNIPHETNYLDTRLPGIMFLNSMREFTPKECAFYLQRLDISPITVVNFSTLLDPIVGSVNVLSETFISGLQRGFSSTVSTVMRTAAKIEAVENSLGNCQLCFLPLSKNLVESFSDLKLCSGNYCIGCNIVMTECGSKSLQNVQRISARNVLDEYLVE